MHIDRYHSYSELAEHEVEGIDFRITVSRRPLSAVAVIAPHGGKIESRTSEIARAIAGEDFNLYLFEGIKKRGNSTLHITSCRFDEPSCLELLSTCSFVIAIHGCVGGDERVLIGGLDNSLKDKVATELREGTEPAIDLISGVPSVRVFGTRLSAHANNAFENGRADQRRAELAPVQWTG